MEKVGYIEKNRLPLGFGLNSIEKLRNIKINYGDRDLIEKRDDVAQIICAGVVMTKDNQILVVSKSAKATSGNSPEKDKSLLYLGGHLDAIDDIGDNIQSFKAGMAREVLEETGMSIEDSSIYSPIVTYTPVSVKSSKHFGVIFPVVIERAFDLSFTDGKCRFVDMASLENVKNFESWSEIIIREIIESKTIQEM